MNIDSNGHQEKKQKEQKNTKKRFKTKKPAQKHVFFTSSRLWLVNLKGVIGNTDHSKKQQMISLSSYVWVVFVIVDRQNPLIKIVYLWPAYDW